MKTRHPVASKHRPRAAVRKRVAAPAKPIRILLADHLALDRRSLVALIRTESDFEVVGEAESTSEAVRKSMELKPGVLLLALRLPGGQAGRTPVADLRIASPSLPILAVAERGEGECVILNPVPPGKGIQMAPSPAGTICSQGTDCLQMAVAEGASGTIRRSAEPAVLFHAIRVVASGEAWYEPKTAAAIMRHALDLGGTTRDLSERELEVAGQISVGRSNKEIAQALAISEPTVKKHVGNILDKLGLQDRLQIGLFVARNPLVLRSSGPSRG